MRFGEFVKPVILAAALSVASLSAQAAGDAVKGKKDFKGKCGVCHTLAEGKNRVGPSLFKIVGRKAGTAPKYRYSADYVEAGKKGLVWDEKTMVDYLKDPKKFIAAFLKKDKAKSKMTIKYKSQKLRDNVAAFLASLK